MLSVRKNFYRIIILAYFFGIYNNYFNFFLKIHEDPHLPSAIFVSLLYPNALTKI